MQNRLAVALLGDQTRSSGLARSGVYRWFTDLDERSRYPEADHDHQSRVRVSVIVHPELGKIELDCQKLFTQNQALLVFTASPGTETYEKLQLLSAIGTGRFGHDPAQESRDLRLR